MEHKQFTSDAFLSRSPQPNQSFQADKFTRKNNFLSIPDTIHEQSSTELSGDSLKMEGFKVLTESFNSEEKQNVNINQEIVQKEFSDNSKINAVDNSFIKNSERKLLESNSKEKVIDIENVAVNKKLLEITSELICNNETISTPPSALRKEISILRNELAEADEFHDLEIQVLKEEKAHNEVDLQTYLQVLEKNAALMDLYTTLKNEYDEYRKEQEKMRHELQSKTADCLESLCSQIEASDNSLNFSSSFVSFNGGIKSSTMMEDISELEATVVHDATILTSDPLSITCDGIFKTPLQTPLRSMKKLFPEEINLTGRTPVVKEMKEIGKGDGTMPLDSQYNIQLLNLETNFNEKVKEVENLEKRLFKIEDMSNVLQSEIEILKDNLSKKTLQLNELTQKLFTETISLNPSLRDSLIDISGTKLLLVFIETIMEKCKNIQDELIAKHSCEKSKWEEKSKFESMKIENLQNQVKSLNEELFSQDAKLTSLEEMKINFEKKLSDAENTILTREVEMRILQANIRQVREDFTSATETFSKVESQLSSTEKEKNELEQRCQKMQETISGLEKELELFEKLVQENHTVKAAFNSIQKENENLKQKVKEFENILTSLKSESFEDKEELMREIESLKNRENSRFDIVFEVLEECRKLTEATSSSPEFKSHENDVFNLLSKKLNNTPDPQLLSAVTAIVEFTKLDLDLKRKLDLTEIENLQNKIKSLQEIGSERETKLTEILAKNNEYNKLCEDLKNQLSTAEGVISMRDEEIMIFKKQEEVLRQLGEKLSAFDESDSCEMLSDRLGTLLTERPEFQHVETEGGKITSIFIETLRETCKGVQNEFVRKIESRKSEWESQRNANLNLINSLQDQIKSMTEKSNQQETEILGINLEKEEMKKLHDLLTTQMTDAQNIILNCNEEIRTLQLHESALKQAKEDLAAADEVILNLKSQLSSTEAVKDEVELRCRQLEKSTTNLQAEIDAKETIIKGLDELKLAREKMESENCELKQQISQAEDVIIHLKRSLEEAKDNHSSLESRIKDLLSEIDFLKKQKESLTDLSEKLEKLEKNNKNLMDIFSDVQSHLNLPEDTISKLLCGTFKNKKIFSETINNLVKTQTENLKAENKNLKIGNDNLKEKVKQLTKLICETANGKVGEELSSLNISQGSGMNLRSRSGKNIDLCVRRLDKLEDMNHNLTELLTRILTITDFPDLEKLRMCSARDFSNLTKKVVAHINGLELKMKELKEENAQLDEECETYSNIIKDLKKEAATVWRTNKEKTEAMELEISQLQEKKSFWENERQKLLTKISRLEEECEKWKTASKAEEPLRSCSCGSESKKINDLKRTILIKEQRLLELQDLEAQTSLYKSQIEYLRSALEREKKKIAEEKERNKKLQDDLKEVTKNQKCDNKKSDQNEILDELRLRGSVSGGVVQEFVDKEKMRKLSKDIGILKELCRARYAEIKRLEAVNASLRNNIPKNSNQMDSPIRTRGYSSRPKNPIIDVWKTEISGKENSPL